MRTRLKILIVLVVTTCFALVCPASEPSDPNRYLNAVREFADNVLKYGRDAYGPKHTPLFVDGLNIHTYEPVKWIAPNGDRWILSNLASQQNLFRTLDGLTRITGEPKYKQAAMDAIRYAFENLRSPNGLLYWGNTTAFDVEQEKVIGWRDRHVLKANLPHYELMWQVDPVATRTFIESFWSAHVRNWSNLDMDRIASFTEVLEAPWQSEYEEGPAFLKNDSGTSFLTTGVDLACAAAWLTKLSGDKEPLVWAKRLIHRYVRTRHPKTGISYWMYKEPSWTVRDSYDSITRKLVPGTTEFLPSEFPWFSLVNRLHYELIRGQITPTPGIPVHSQVSYWQAQFLLGEMSGKEGNQFEQWALEELTAFGKASYRKPDNVYVPILTDGTNIEGYVVKETTDMLGPRGATLKAIPVYPPDLWAYAMAYRVTRDAFMWQMARHISKGNEFGDIGSIPEDHTKLDHTTNCPNPYALLAFLELYRGTGKDELLHMAKRIGDNLLAKRFHREFFVASTKHVYTKFDAIDSLALLHLHLALAGDITKIPEVWPSVPYFYSSYRSKDWTNDNEILYARTESCDPPLSLLEAARLGDIEKVKAIISRGRDVDAFESSFLKTALHEAAIGGHEEIAKLLIANGAHIDARDSWPGCTPLNYAAEHEHMEVVELFIAKGADINAKRKSPIGDTPLHSAVKSGHKAIVEMLADSGADLNARNDRGEAPLHIAVQNGQRDIVELLIDKGADVNIKNKRGQTPLDIALSRNRKQIIDLLSKKGVIVSTIHIAALAGDLEKVRSFIDDGIDVNAKDEGGMTPLLRAISGKHSDVARFLIEAGADVNMCDEQDYVPLVHALWALDSDMVKLLLNEGADIHAKDTSGYTPLHWAVMMGSTELTELVLDAGADVNANSTRGETPLDLAKQGGPEIVELLKKHGAKE